MKNLLATPVGRDSKFPAWFNRGAPNFDFLALCYEDVDDEILECATYVFKNKDYKFSNFRKYTNIHPDIIHSYDFFFLADDDLDMSTERINGLFRLAEVFGLDLCQPSLSHQSYCSWAITLWCGDPKVVLRYTDFVEIMCPLFSRRGISLCLETFGKNSVGMGLDFVWPKLLGFKNMAIIDRIRVTHGRPMRDWTQVIDSEREWRIMRDLYDVKTYEPKVYQYVIEK
ncbi:MAG: DUF707 domain-containing protein [Deltaproteobacteria bacterium]|nr:DUF707 domain-containing protein [Deltaproteobacteria bacterium]